jgi:AbrB family looped-hinge helix DNA binding protein
MNKYEKICTGGLVYETVCVVGERGQITIPKTIREISGLRKKDKVIVKMEGTSIVVEKKRSKKETEHLLKEYHREHGNLDLEIVREWDPASKEADAMIDDY